MARDMGYAALCYHYIRPPKAVDPFPRILGNRLDEFERHVRHLKSEYQILSPEDVYRFSYGHFPINGNGYGLLFTFDDGLSDHFHAARILSEHGIQALFFIPTCILAEGTPANPIIIHYGIARYGISGFLRAFREAIEDYRLPLEAYEIPYEQGKDDPWKTIVTIKSHFKYRLDYRTSRKVLLHIYKNHILREYPEALELMHLTKEQVAKMLEMKHAIGVHSLSHISVAATELEKEDFEKEILEPKTFLETLFNTSVTSFSYPYGERQDCLPAELLTRDNPDYRLAFTIQEILNTRETHPLELGRYMPRSTDDEKRLIQVLKGIIAGMGHRL